MNPAGPAPVPPSDPSTTTKSGARPSATIARHTARNSRREPTHSLNPIGLPPASSRSRARNSTSSRGVEKTRCEGGDTTVSPTGTFRSRAISALTFTPGSTPPLPGADPWDSFNDTHLTSGSAALSANSRASKPPSASRQPKYPVPISQTRSPPPRRWCSDSPPSPVSCAKRPSAAPLLRASTARDDSAPKLIADTFSSAMS